MNYLAVSLHKGGRGAGVRVHTLVLEAFVGPRPQGAVACHNDGDIENNAPSNLRWDTQKENIRDILRHGRHHLVNKTHCPQGHEYSPENTYIVPATGGRSCRQCREAKFSGSKRRGPRRKAAHCGNGHEWNAENTYVSPNTGIRSCRACGREKARRKHQRLKRERESG